MRNEFTAIIERDGEWYIAYCLEIPGANGQGRTVLITRPAHQSDGRGPEATGRPEELAIAALFRLQCDGHGAERTGRPEGVAIAEPV